MGILTLNICHTRNPADFFYKITKTSPDKCDFYNLYKFTDDQEWRSAAQLLNRLKIEEE